eukprot:10519505-Lingulodinium_polyedra.AAC.1
MATDGAHYALWRLIGLLCAQMALGIFVRAENHPLALLAATPELYQALVFVGKKVPSSLARGQRPLAL